MSDGLSSSFFTHDGAPCVDGIMTPPIPLYATKSANIRARVIDERWFSLIYINNLWQLLTLLDPDTYQIEILHSTYGTYNRVIDGR